MWQTFDRLVCIDAFSKLIRAEVLNGVEDAQGRCKQEPLREVALWQAGQDVGNGVCDELHNWQEGRKEL